MAFGPYKITEEFEKAICDYTGAPFCCVVDSCSHAIFLSLKYQIRIANINISKNIRIPKHTFPSIPCEIIHAGLNVRFYDSPKVMKGPYRLEPTKVWDSALRFTKDMYMPDSFMCISFTGPRKKLKLIKGGAILHDSPDAQKWFISARMSGRHECSFMEDNIQFPGWNYYLDPEKSARGLMLIREFYNEEGEALPNLDVECEYPDLSLMDAFK